MENRSFNKDRLGRWLARIGRGRAVPAEAELFCAEWLKRRYEGISERGLRIGLVMNTMMIGVLPVVGPHNPLLLFAAHAVIEVGLIAWFLGVGKGRVGPRFVVLGIQLIALLAYGVNLGIIMRERPDETHVILASSTYMVMSIVFVMLNPIGAQAGWGLIALYVIGGGLAMRGNPAMGSYMIIHLMAAAMTLLVFRLLGAQSLSEAVHEFHDREMTRLAAKLERERDLEFAREIQDSMLPALAYDGPQLTIRCGQRKAEKIGGDWLGLRGAGGEAVIVVADAAGSGVHAGLVVQAVQALWARALGSPLDVGAWLREVNGVLLLLGAKKPQTMTVGVVEIKGDEITYWSAGHVPLYVEAVPAPGLESSLTALVSPGSVLGLSSVVTFEPRRILVPAAGRLTLLLGSDGVFDKGTRYARAELARAFAGAKDPERYLDGLSKGDDRSLVVVSVSGAAAAERAA